MIADLKFRILEGVYRVKAEQVAEKMIQHGIYVLGTLKGHDRYLF